MGEELLGPLCFPMRSHVSFFILSDFFHSRPLSASLPLNLIKKVSFPHVRSAAAHRRTQPLILLSNNDDTIQL